MSQYPPPGAFPAVARQKKVLSSPPPSDTICGGRSVHTDIQSHRHTNTHRHTDTHTLRQTSHTHYLSRSRSSLLSRALFRSLSYSPSYTPSIPRLLCPSARSLSRSLALSLSRTLMLYLSPPHSLYLSHSPCSRLATRNCEIIFLMEATRE
jgi:hypothetical protein